MAAALVLVLVLLLAGVAGAALAGRDEGRLVTYGLSLGATTLLLLLALLHLAAAAAPVTMVLPLGLPWQGAAFRLDSLAAFFLLVVNLGAATASLFALGYGRHESAPGRVLPFYPWFLAGMNLVVLADDAFTFLFAWESMSLASWALVLAHHKEPGNARAGYVYLVMASFGTLALLLAMGLLAGAEGAYGFEAMRARAHGPTTTVLVLALVLLGAGSKAGIVPLHVWLPLAHPAAPSHVSALMSGVMTKVAVYALIRIVMDLLGPPEWWWGAVILLIGGVTAVMGVLQALMQHDLKRLLAYHTVENIGIVYIGLGLSLAFQANAMAGPAALALTAALFHVVNHATFKSLLFMGAGAVLGATGLRDMERLGGLLRVMPATGFLFLVGSAAISALPPLNGFVSEWLTFQAILLSPDLPQWLLRFVVPAVGAMLALSAALAAACFVKAFGITFLGRPRSPAAARAEETDPFSLAAMAALALLCLLLGILPGAMVDLLAPVVADLAHAGIATRGPIGWALLVPVDPERSAYSGLLVFVLAGGVAMATAWAVHRFASQALRRAPAWDCGFPDPDPATQYTATSFAQPIRRVFGATAFAAIEAVQMPPPLDPRPARLRVVMRDLVWDRLYLPLAHLVEFVSGHANRLQFLTIRRYLSLVFAALVILLTVLTVWR